MNQLFLFFGIFLLTIGVLHAQSPQDYWEESRSAVAKSSNLESPDDYTLFRLTDYDAAFKALLSAPERGDTRSENETLFTLPNADGSRSLYSARKTPVMAPKLAARYPDISTYTLTSKDDLHAIAKVNFGPSGFHAMIRRPGKTTVFIEPWNLRQQVYMVFTKEDYPQPEMPFHCMTEESHHEPSELRLSGDCSLREYRLALACTGEYGQFHGGTVSEVMDAFNVTMNRVNGVFESEASITMTMVPNNDNLIFLDGTTDPYTNSNTFAMLAENQTTCDNVIGSANYDIGHVFSTGGGGVAYLRSSCNSSVKAGGVSGRSNPVGDPFDIDLVSHEFGHQYGANHTQNNDCNRSSASYEPGSGSTIMSYAGICPPNVQFSSDPYFHSRNLTEMGDFVTNPSTGASCAVVVSSSNTPPTADAGSDYTVPISTAFELTGTGSDPGGGLLTYCWEQYNNDVSPQPPSPTSTQGPNFRSLLPTTSPSRQFPALGISNTWEVLPSVSRTMDFRLTIRDYNEVHGYGCTDEDFMVLTFHDGAGPFALTSANGGELWLSGRSDTVQWDVANTDIAPINCTAVDILLSTDGGQTYPHTLATNVANDGQHVVTLPSVITTQARLKIKAVGNVFFDVSDANFEIDIEKRCVTYQSADVPITISNSSTGTYTSDLNISDTGSIYTVEVLDLTGTHTWVQDLDFDLIHPDNTVIDLIAGVCGNLDNFNMGFIDGGSAESCPLDQGLMYNPTDSLTGLRGKSGDGTWQLRIEDTFGADGGQLNSWGLEVCYLVEQDDCPPSLTLDSSPVLDGTYKAANSILATVPIDSSASVIFQSMEINLERGFLVPTGAQVEAVIGGCD